MHTPLHLTRAQARAVDEIAATRFSMPTVLLMENAARSAAAVAWRLLGNKPGEVLILCGPGNNGGDGLGLARHLANRGCGITCALLDPQTPYRGDALIMYEIAARSGLSLIPASLDLLLPQPSLIVDALFGTGLSKPLTGLALQLATATSLATCPVLALDLPSGLDCDTGNPTGPAAVKATHTITFVAPKAGFQNPASRAYTGEVLVGDIGVPPEAIGLALAQTPQ